jgi:hypothetical protein
MWDDLNSAMTDTFGEAVTWRRAGGGESGLFAVPDFRAVTDEMGVAGVSNTVVTITLLASSLAGLNRHEDRFVLRGVPYRAAQPPVTDAAGMMAIILERAS